MVSAQEIAACLAATLSSDNNTRIAAELKLAEYIALPGMCLSEISFTSLLRDDKSDTALALSQLVIAQDVDLSLRQMS